VLLGESTLAKVDNVSANINWSKTLFDKIYFYKVI
jgi:hypothetical protein